MQYAYDAVGRVLSITYPDGGVEARSYTGGGLLASESWRGSPVATLGYDAGGRRTRVDFGNGVSEVRAYATGPQVSAIGVRSATGAGLVDLAYGYDGNGRKQAEVDGRTTERGQGFGYDAADRLVAWTRGAAHPTEERTWDLSPVGDWRAEVVDGLSTLRSHDAAHGVTQVGGRGLSSDATGNLTQDEQARRLSWDADGRLAGVDGGALGSARYLYDAFGRRVARQARGVLTRFVYDGERVIQEIDTVLQVPAESPAARDDGGLARLATPPAGAILADRVDESGCVQHPERINVQPATTPIPDGYIADKGRAFGLRTNGLVYGWSGELVGGPEPQERRFHPLPAYDTMASMGTPAVWSWAQQLPNGSYPVVIMLGDPTSRRHANTIRVNGQRLVDPDPFDPAEVPGYIRGDYDGYAVQVEVVDGSLRIEAEADALDPVLCFLEVGPRGAVLTDAERERLAAAVDSATARTGGASAYGQPETRSLVYGSYVDEPLQIEMKSAEVTTRTIPDPAMAEQLLLGLGWMPGEPLPPGGVREAALLLGFPEELIDELLASLPTVTVTDAAMQVFYVHANHLYSVMALTDAAGDVVERREYGPYGEMTVYPETGTAPVGLSAGFTGREWDDTAGLVYFRNRWYSPTLGRFISRDPAGYVDGMNLYRGYFVPGGSDPYGLWKVGVHQGRTTEWARRLSLPADSAKIIGDADEAVDNNFWPIVGTSWVPIIFGDSSYHFNTTGGAGAADSRNVHARTLIAKAKSKGREESADAAKESLVALGAALHPAQDYYAHGEWKAGASGVWSIHAGRQSLATVEDYAVDLDIFDDPTMDSSDGDVDGRPFVMHDVSIQWRYGGKVPGIQTIEYMLFSPGGKRIAAAERVTTSMINEMILFIRNEGSCEARKVYGQ